MNRRWQRIEQIFHEAVQTPKADRDSFLEQACGADESMRKEVELLLAQPPSTMSIMDGALGGAALRVIAEQTENRLSGRTLLQYEIGARIGAGGMGEVYVARDQKLDRKVALKLLPGQLIGTDDQVRALRQEARAASALNHPNIITVYDLGQAEQFDFIAMEFISGETLRQKLRGGRLPIKQSVDIAMQIASALAAAHREGIVHRDIKPENVMVRDDGLVKILDFGIAKLQQESNGDAAPSEPRLSSYPPVSGTGCGTVHYLSPEQARRESVDGQSDIFALGIVFYEMLAGKRPFNGDSNAETIDAILNGEPAALSDQRASIPVELQRIVSRSLNKNRNERYQSVTDMLADLAGLKERFERDQPRAYVIEQFRPRTRGLLALAALLASLAAVHLLVFPSPRAWLAADVVALALATGCASAAVYLWRRNRPQRSLAETGFHGLSPFQEEDRERFFGREQDTRALVRMTKKEEFRFGLLYGESGSGKTSIITAGLAPELRAAGFEIIVCRSSKDPLASLVESFRRRYDVVPQDSEQPEDYIARAMNSILQRDRSFRKLMVICDQFEEFFVRFKTPSEREPFLSFVERCQRAEDLPLSFLFCIRADVLHHFITAFDTRIPEPLLGEKRYGLRSFDEEQAEDVIEKTFAQCGLEVQREFRDLIARDLAVNGTVLPSELQILGSQLQFRRILTVADYLRAGGKERLLHGFVEDVVRSSPDRKTALAILPAMVSGEGVRRTITLDELVTRTQREQSVVETVLRHLEQARLIREVQENRRSGYELIHDYLIEGINEISGKVMNSKERANRSLRQYVSTYSVDRRTRIPLAQAWSIRRFSDAAKGPVERELLGKSLRWGVAKASALVLLILLGSIGLAAAFSVREDWEPVRLSDGHAMAVRQIAMSPEGRLLVSVGEDARVTVWDFARRTILAVLTDHTDKVYSVAFSPDGRYFATGSQDKRAIVWSASNFDKAAVEKFPGPVVSVAFSPDGRLLAAASSIPDPRITIWRVDGWKKAREWNLEGEIGAPWNLCFSPDSRWLLAPRDQSGSRVWDTVSGRLIEHEDESRWNSGVRALSRDGTKMITVGGGNAFFWSLRSYWSGGRRQLEGSSRAHEDFARAAAFSPDGRLAATGCEDIVLWDPATRELVGRLAYSAIVWGLAFSQDGLWLVSSHADGAILVWDIRQQKVAANFNGHSGPVRTVAFSPDGKCIASGGDDHTVIIWNTDSRQKEAVSMEHDSWVNGVAFSPDGKILASADQGGAVTLSIVADTARLWETAGFAQYCVAVSPDNRWVASTRGVSDARDGRLVLDFSKPGTGGGEMYSVSFSPDGKLLSAVSPGNRLISVWDTGDWRLLGSVRTGGVPLTSISVSPDGKSLVTGDDDGVVRLWSVSPLHEEAIIGSHASRVKSVAFSHDGTRIVSAGDDKTIALWDFAGRKLITRIGVHTARVLSVAFAPDDRQIVSGEEDNSVNLYTRRRTLWGHRID